MAEPILDVIAVTFSGTCPHCKSILTSHPAMYINVSDADHHLSIVFDCPRCACEFVKNMETDL